ncbi:MAG: AAA family ATPase [Polyangiaceae bacterium]
MELKVNDFARFSELLGYVREVFPDFSDFSFAKERKARRKAEGYTKVIERYPARSLHLRFGESKPLPARAVSEGVLMVVGILAALLSPERPRLFLIEDIDRALHPREQRIFVRRLRQLRLQLDIQIVATTHSPFLVDCFEANEVAVLLRDPTSGRISSSLLSEHPEADLLDALSTGEFWMARGENREEKPAPEATRVGD